MKKISPLCMMLFSIFATQAQVAVNDSVSLSSNYANMSFYSLANGEQANVNAKDWDLQIWNNLMSASIRVNDGAGVMLYRLVNDDTTDWNSVDTTGMTPLYNSDTSWETGAFSALAGVHPDYGWGIYDDFNNGNLKGYRIFVIKTLNGNYKKIWVKRHVWDGISAAYYEIAIANLDNSNEENITISKTDYPTKSFTYYSIDSAEIKDIEPQKNNWDIVLRRYQTLTQGQYYTVMGVLTHPDVLSAEARGVEVSSNDYTPYSFSENISVIGSDWKNFNQSTFQWEIMDSLAYFVAAQDGYYYKVIFTGFGGQGTGKVVFNKTQLEPPATAVSEVSNLESLTTYPNPATDRIQTLFTLKNDADVTVRVLDLAGKSHLSIAAQARAGLNNFSLNIAELSQGFYLLSVDDGNSKLTFKFVKN